MNTMGWTNEHWGTVQTKDRVERMNIMGQSLNNLWTNEHWGTVHAKNRIDWMNIMGQSLNVQILDLYI